MNKKLSRRDFLWKVSTITGAVGVQQILAGCSPREIPTPETVASMVPIKTLRPTPSTVHVTQSAQPSNTDPEETQTPTVEPTKTDYDMVVARGGEPEALVRQALAALGGMERFVKAGAYVIIKPNMCTVRTYEYAATTNPWVVGTLVKLCMEAGARKVQVMDFPFGGPPDQTYVTSGIAEQVKAAGGEMVIMSGFKFKPADIPDGVILKSYKIYDDALKADTLINVPILKNHGLAGLTIGLKNLMGLVQDRPNLHGNLGQLLPDIASRIRPALTIVDAVRVLMANGPTGGNLADVKKMDTIIASPDIVAADTYAANLFGFDPEKLAYIQAGALMGLGRKDLQNLKIGEINVAA